ncbi:hypothetical protein BDY19DRAFT_680917 [Irpex rosettiformis]|uniref:Uncharacterized protein n=1 Tax=Irpex rosettiformis TaxID=378272 RepID=A0ACB8U9Z0_9APHY|nr:hypothetical protein BDY19DRAFT_680917 [Irpex rosettiformis]
MTLDNFTKHPDLWFEDGNVVLVAEGIGFRVYGGLLAKHSKIFCDMFSVPQPELKAEDTCEGYPVVCLPDDGAEELAAVLNIIYDTNSSKRFYSRATRVPFLIVAAAIRLGYKYAFNEIKDEALRRISLCYPRDWKKSHWDSHWHGGSNQEQPETSADAEGIPACQIVWNPTGSIVVFHLARQLGLDDLVPAALYRCANDLSVESLFAATNQKDRFFTLSQSELQDCIQAREDLSAHNVSLYGILSKLKISPECALKLKNQDQTSSCRNTMSVMTTHAHASHFMDGRAVLDPFRALFSRYKSHESANLKHSKATNHHTTGSLAEVGVPSPSLCSACFSDIYLHFLRKQEGVWVELSTKFCPYPRYQDSDADNELT